MVKLIVYIAMALIAIGMIVTDTSQGPGALLMALILGCLTLIIFRRYTEDTEFITYVFLGALCARLAFGVIVHAYDLRSFVGSDALGYDTNAAMIVNYWYGKIEMGPELSQIMSLRGSGWGMQYLVAFIYLISDNSIFVAQTFCAVIGAATAPTAYFCANSMFNNRRVARTAAIAVAFFPAFIIWSSQLLKDGLIVFMLVLTLTLVLQLQKQFSWVGLLLLAVSLFGILTLRFYVFYVVVAAVVGSFFIGLSNSMVSIIQRTTILVFVAVILFYLGVIKTATSDIETYGSLERAQVSRLDLARSAESGFGSGEDVSTVRGVLSVLPVGFAYLMFAPFPWEMSNLRQSITLPDVLLWWSMMPLLVYGLWYALKNKLRASFPVLLFTLLLTISYSIFQGNVGTAYRQRTQIQVFLFMFIAVGWQLIRENREDKKLLELNRQKKIAGDFRKHLRHT